jgi:hypothetical protein
MVLHRPVELARITGHHHPDDHALRSSAEEHKKEAAKKFENFKALSVIKLAERAQGAPTISTTLQ